MGWTTLHRQPGQTDRDFIQREIVGHGHTILDGVTKGFTFYGAVRNDDTGEVFAIVVLQHRSRGYENYGYKAMDETVGPFEIDCPDRILDMLTPTENEYANGWRAKARAKNAAKAARPKVKAGDTIRFDQPLRFTNGLSFDTFRYESGSSFVALGLDGGIRVHITRWRDRKYAKVTP